MNKEALLRMKNKKKIKEKDPPNCKVKPATTSLPTSLYSFFWQPNFFLAPELSIFITPKWTNTHSKC